ncbi:MAG: D-alanine--D-alanine ligase [Endomicrobiia bacterium]
MNLRNKKIGVLYGGISEEREISIKSGNAVISALKSGGYNVVPIDVKQDFLKKIQTLKSKIDIAFIALHGPFGEDGTVQSILEMLRIPYTGSGVLASALAMNKIYSKKIFEWHKLRTPGWFTVNSEKELLPEKLKFPLVVKPCDQGSTIGVRIVNSLKELKSAIKYSLKYSKNAIVEKYIEGKELTVGILGREALPVVEIIPMGKSKFYDFEAKYAPGGSKHIIPARIDSKTTKLLQEMALKAFDALGCKAVGRVDFRLNKNEKPYILEINTIPGMTETSLLPEAAKERGYSFLETVLKIIEHSI